MKVADFDYDLPPEHIAQRPAEPRESARLLVHDVPSDRTEHARVSDLPRFLRPADLLVLNETRVRSARLCGVRGTGGAVEMLLLERISSRGWRALVRPAARLRPGELVELENGELQARMLKRFDTADEQNGSESAGAWSVELIDPKGAEDVAEKIERIGRMPLPPYIKRSRREDPFRELDRHWYQTAYAREAGAIAAPTAGLHLTLELLEQLRSSGVESTALTLHVGEGTFRPVVAETTDEHRMHAERYALPEEAAAAVRRCRAKGGRVVAVGSTSLRVLETCAAEGETLRAQQGETSLFIVPGYPFRVVDVLLTNFHLPRSTLLMMVAAFAGHERILRLYREAIERGYRFFSYGDAMLLQITP